MTDDLDQLKDMPQFLRERASKLPDLRFRQRPRAGGFAFVEQVWHLADLEREGFGQRIRRLREELNPALPDFDGERNARERNYLQLDLAEGLTRFSRAREDNLAALGALAPAEWERAGEQQGVGRVSLSDIPRMMAEHDGSHRKEIEELVAELEAATSPE
jgi:hypothetical protein